MSFRTIVPPATKLALLTGVHQSGDEYRIALYEKTAPTNKYVAAGESGGQGYVAGGQRLGGYKAGIVDDLAYVSWAVSPKWERASIKAAEAIIYNASKGGAVLMVLQFDDTYVSKNGPFDVEFPAPGVTGLLVL
jgi:hypothetical protein